MRSAVIRAGMDSIFGCTPIDHGPEGKHPKPVRFSDLCPKQKRDALERLLEKTMEVGFKPLAKRFPELVEILKSIRAQVDQRLLEVREERAKDQYPRQGLKRIVSFIENTLHDMESLVIGDDLAWLID